MTMSREEMYKMAVDLVIAELKRHTKMPAVVLQHRIREDYGLDMTSKELSAAIKKYGRKKIKFRTLMDDEMNFGTIYTTRDTMIYELIK